MSIPKPVKIISYIIGLVAALLLFAVILIPLVVNPDDYRGTIEQIVLEKTGRQLTIEGHIELSLFPWLGVKLGQVSLADNPAFGPAPFARFNSAGIRVRLLPLLSKNLEVDRITLYGLRLKLRTNKQGAHNWDDLASQTKKPDAATTPKKPGALPLAALAIGGIDLQDARLSWDDQQQRQHYEIKDLTLNSGPVALGQPFDINTHFRFTSRQPETQGDIKLAARLNLDLKAQHYQARKLQLQIKLQGAAIPNGKLVARLDVGEQNAIGLAAVPARAPQAAAVQRNAVSSNLGSRAWACVIYFASMASARVADTSRRASSSSEIRS